MESKKHAELTDRVLHVEVVGLSSSLWRQIRVPGKISIKELGKIIRTAFGWARKSHAVFVYPEKRGYRQGPLNPEEEKIALEQIFRSTDDLFFFDLYRGREPGWSHLIRCVAFRERSDFAIIENGAGEAPPTGESPFNDSSVLAGLLLGGVLAASKRPVAGFDLVAANERLRNRAGAKTSYAQNRCRAIIPIDSRSIRGEWENKLNDLKRQVEKLEALIRKHDEIDEPAFRTWLRKKFGPALSGIQQAGERLAGLRQRFRLISLLDAKYRGRKSKAELFRLALAVEAGNAPWPEEAEEEFEHSLDRENLRRAARNISPAEREIFEAQVRELEDEFGEIPPQIYELRDILNSVDSNDLRERCKSVYRKIVLLLHPDRIGVLDGSKLDLWHRTQNAYESGDLVALEAILDGCSVQVNEKSIAEIQQAVENGKQQIERLTLRIARMKKEPAWNFSNQKGKKLESREQRVRRDIAKERDELEFQLEILERESARFEHALRQSESKRRKNQMELFS